MSSRSTDSEQFSRDTSVFRLTDRLIVDGNDSSCSLNPHNHPAIMLLSYLLICTYALVPSGMCRFRTHSLQESSSSSTENTTKGRLKIRIPILQYHDDWCCVNKPSGISIHKTKNTSSSQPVLLSILKRQLGRKVYPVHRLDHRTSGVLLIAFNPQTCASLHSCLRWSEDEEDEDEGNIDNRGKVFSMDSARKEYIALVRGDWRLKWDQNEVVRITKPLLVHGIYQDAVTDFQCLASYSIPPTPEYPYHHPSACSLLKCIPQTGRTHQIRRHAASMSMPVLGDNEHGDSKINRWWREQRGMDRLFLHCLSLNLPPIQHKILGTHESVPRIECTAPLTENLMEVLKREDMKRLWEECVEREPRLLLESVDERGGTFGRNYKKRDE